MKKEIPGLVEAMRIVRSEKACVRSGMDSTNIATEIRTLDRVEQMLQWRLDAANGEHHRSAQALLDTFAKIGRDIKNGN